VVQELSKKGPSQTSGGRKSPSGVQGQSPVRGSGGLSHPEAEAKCEITVQFLMFFMCVQNVGLMSLGAVYYCGNTEFKKILKIQWGLEPITSLGTHCFGKRKKRGGLRKRKQNGKERRRTEGEQEGNEDREEK